MKHTALITGASNGIGLELARIHAERGGGLVLVARSQNKLEQLAQELRTQYGSNVTVIAQDLAAPQAAQAVFAQTEQAGIQVDILINNAGFGGHGRFFERELAKEQQMIQLNITALTELTHLYLQDMVARRSGKILNVSSTASFMPGPLQAVYYASKAYVTSFSQALAEEVREFGVTVTALCPGAVATGFVDAGGLQDVGAWKNAKSAQSVAEYGYRAMEKGELVAFNEGKLKFALEWIIPLLPRKTVLKMSRKAMEK
ncbi:MULTISPECIES: SDR family oxidoreductase [unclassified Neisseria]|uniref:SDR family NAD(P)-dependent oxidoreductase n=1 Tax=unclassified Neisseria TaxID=2623750 RepID=UPI001071B483|nr:MULTISPECIES: SDR family oxidoreductase [unclassified Neisseria]MBF0803409.1 SDR family oxidoreductase [Neisseria sp. 19428wB4_WF04]TFU43918.1 SDR family oxidoreductase [Neisseria sp. WF04]